MNPVNRAHIAAIIRVWLSSRLRNAVGLVKTNTRMRLLGPGAKASGAFILVRTRLVPKATPQFSGRVLFQSGLVNFQRAVSDPAPAVIPRDPVDHFLRLLAGQRAIDLLPQRILQCIDIAKRKVTLL